MIEGIPDGWELIRIGKPVPKVDWVINNDGTPVLCSVFIDVENWPIIRKIEKPKKFRAFANAAEFEWFRDRWIKRTYNGDLSNAGCFKPQAYDDQGVFDIGEHFTYRELFDDGRQFDDGTPFGIQVTE